MDARFGSGAGVVGSRKRLGVITAELVCGLTADDITHERRALNRRDER